MEDIKPRPTFIAASFIEAFRAIVEDPQETVYKKFSQLPNESITTWERNYFAISLGVISGIFAAVAYRFNYKGTFASLGESVRY